MDKLTLIVLLLCLNIVLNPLAAQKKIAFAEGVANKKEVKLSAIASDVKYIPLETTLESLLEGKAVHLNVAFAGEFLFVCDGNHIYQFSPEGKYIRKIGQRGQGPGEFQKHILDVVYDEAGERIFATDYLGGEGIVFSFDGKYLYDFKLKGRFKMFHQGCLYGYTDNFLLSKDRTGTDLYLSDDRGKQIKEFRFNYKPDKRYPQLIFDQGSFYQYSGRVYYKNPLEEVIYCIEGKKKTPAYLLDLAQYEKYEEEESTRLVLDKKNQVGKAVQTEAGKKRFDFKHIYETDAYLFLAYYQEEEYRLGVYDKHRNRAFRVHSSMNKADGFVDDLEGGIPFMPVQGNEKVLVNIIPAEELLEKVKPLQAKGSLKKVMENLLEDDNPVLQVITLNN